MNEPPPIRSNEQLNPEQQHREQLESLAYALLENETIEVDEIQAICGCGT